MYIETPLKNICDLRRDIPVVYCAGLGGSQPVSCEQGNRTFGKSHSNHSVEFPD